MILMVVCGVMLLVGLAAAAAWGRMELTAPADGSPWARYVWWVDVGLVSGLLGGLLVAGAGGRLAMRLLAVTAGAAAQGKLTEAEEVVGDIDLGGTLALFVFGGIFFGVVVGGLYVLLNRVLPRRWLGGLTLGALLLVVAATRIDPLRPDNEDFGLVGPGWLGLLVFGALCFATPLAVAAIAARVGASLPLLSGRWTTWPPYLPLLLLLPGVAVMVPAVIVGIAYLGAQSMSPERRASLGPLGVRAGRLVLGAAAAVSLPGFVQAVVDIAPT